jgi:crotonobetainyl-CoA:carnitine CoA-transferase CaiB-like acyl-CoA transferase
VLHRAEVVDWLAPRFATAPRAHWLERLRAARVPAGEVRDIQEVVRDPVLVGRGMIAPQVSLGSGDSVDLFALPWRVDGGRPSLRLPPPQLGEHTEAFRERFGE